MATAAVEVWNRRANEAQDTLERLFWNDGIRMYDIETPCPDGACNTIFHYWWMAHAADALTDAYERTGEKRYLKRLGALYEGIIARNGGALPNELYDDMEWMALAWLRAYRATGEEAYRQAAILLWEDIQTGWNEHMGGGIAWRKSQLDYKNTPANAPAVILAARLYQAFGKPEDLSWAYLIYRWQRAHLVDPVTGFVWDGMNRTGDGRIDKDWRFTYCQGVYIGAAVELYRITGQRDYLDDAVRTYRAAVAGLTDPATGLLPDEGGGDGALFKGIFVRYAAELARMAPGMTNAEELLTANAKRMWNGGKRPGEALFGPDWASTPKATVPLSAQLSAVMLLEQAARFGR